MLDNLGIIKVWDLNCILVELKMIIDMVEEIILILMDKFKQESGVTDLIFNFKYKTLKY